MILLQRIESLVVVTNSYDCLSIATGVILIWIIRLKKGWQSAQLSIRLQDRVEPCGAIPDRAASRSTASTGFCDSTGMCWPESCTRDGLETLTSTFRFCLVEPCGAIPDRAASRSTASTGFCDSTGMCWPESCTRDGLETLTSTFRFCLVEPCGIEPQTFWMQTRRSPS